MTARSPATYARSSTSSAARSARPETDEDHLTWPGGPSDSSPRVSPTRSGPSRWSSGKLIPCATFQDPSRSLLVRTAPLFEKERHTGPVAEITDLGYPGRLHGASTGTGFAPRDHPVDADEGQCLQTTEQRFQGEELDSGARTSEILDPSHVTCALDADTHPHVRRPLQG